EGILSSEQQDKFHTIFKENATFYKFRFYKAIFNSKKDEETKLRLLRSWIQENAEREVSLTNYILTAPPQDRPWQPVTERPLYWLPNHLEGFIESHRESGESYLTSLWQQFNRGMRTATISSTIAGMGGVGKTSLALAYAHEALENKGYHLIYWLLSETESSLLKGYQDLLERINIPYKSDDADTHIIELIKEHLPHFGKCLLIYDNVPDPKFLEGKVPEANHIDILITSRWSQGWGGELIDLAVFRPKDSVHYLLQTIGLKDTLDTQAKVRELAEELGHLPLALSHAAHYLKLVGGEEVSGDIIDKYIKKFRETPIDHFEKRQNPFEFGKSAINYEHLIGRTFQMTREKLSGLAQQLMIYCAYLDPDTIVEEIFLQGLQGNSQEELQAAFEQLSAYSLIKRREKSPVFHMHRLLQLMIQIDQERNIKHVNNLKSLKGIFNEVSLTEAENYVFLDRSLKIKGFDLLNLHERLGKYLINLERIINHCKDLKIKGPILAPYQVIYQNINRTWRTSKERIFKLKNELPENSPGEDKAISLLKKELGEGGLNLDNEQCRLIFRLIPQYSQQSDRLRIAKILSSMDLSQCQEFIESFKQLFTPDMRGEEQASIIEALAQVKADQRQSVATNAKQLITSDMRGDAPGSIIIALGNINPAQRQGIAANAKQLITSDMRGDERSSIITALARIKADQRQDFKDSVKKIFPPGMGGYEQASIITALAQVEAGQRQDFIDSVKQLFAPGMRGEEQASIITALAQV
ncbi:MAG: hypothetical protein K0M45_06735, partial [Candidatus Paracaedibacteraceae bacterium]|nr:hypothetical protein [Candidatus Paracaedibacteraceae bacterium]